MAMTPERWQQINKLVELALEQEPDRRSAFLDEACQGDRALREEVESFLAARDQVGSFLNSPAFEAVASRKPADSPQSLMGRPLGHYQILSRLGEGGMGIVYKARDQHLNRFVAIKVLPRHLMADRERQRRFVQEARAASALNHPNIITIHDIASEGDTDFMVMEYVEGKTLDQLIPRRGLKLNEALTYGIQIADALAKAHADGIVHRDLKPGNIMVSQARLVKLLDFGLAKLTERPHVGEAESTGSLQPQTEEGMILGTASYMSPEQAEGKKVDARSDIFSFGAVLYEMVTGQKAFAGESNLAILTAILREEPKPASQIVKGLPHELEKIIHRCLRKDPGWRFQHMDDVRVELGELKEESAKLAETPLSKSASRSSALQARPTWVWAGATLVVVSIIVAAWLFRGTARKPQATLEVVPLTTYAGFENSPSFSPDGNQVAFSWNGEKQDNFDIYIKLIGSPTPVRLTTDPAEDLSPAFSPDGRSIGFVRVSKDRVTLIVIPAIGGPERVLGEVPSPHFDISPEHMFAWFPGGKWVVIDGLALLSMESGEMRSLTSPPAKLLPDSSPAVSPDGRTIAFSRSTSLQMSEIYLLNLSEDLKPGGEPRRLTFLKGFINGAAWTPNGREIIFSFGVFGSGSLWKVPASGVGEPEQLPFSPGGGAAFCPAISRSGNRLAYQHFVLDTNIWRLSLSSTGVAGSPPDRFIASTRYEDAAQYSPDGKRIAFESDRSGVNGIWVCDADATNAVELFSRRGVTCGTERWSPDGQHIAFDSDMEGNFDIYVIRASGGKPTRLTTVSADDIGPSWSRDGKWVYFASIRAGRWEAWKVSAGGGEAVQVTRNGGNPAFESLDGKSIYYTKAPWSGALWKMPASGGEESQVLPSAVYRGYSLVKDGLYFIQEPDPGGKYSIQFLSFSTGKVKTVTPMSGVPGLGLSVSPDGGFLLFSQLDKPVGSDLILVENFR